MAKNNVTLKDGTYDKLKWAAQIVLPALGAAYFGLARIWGLPFAEEVVGSLAVVGTLLGTLLGLSVKGYEGDGYLGVAPSMDEDGALNPDVAILLNKGGEALSGQKYVRLKVKPGARRSDLLDLDI